MIININQLDFTFSYMDYYMWKFENRAKLFKGKIFEIGPSPRTHHQQISENLAEHLGNILKIESHHLFMTPFDVRFINAGNSIKDEYVSPFSNLIYASFVTKVNWTIVVQLLLQNWQLKFCLQEILNKRWFININCIKKHVF